LCQLAGETLLGGSPRSIRQTGFENLKGLITTLWWSPRNSTGSPHSGWGVPWCMARFKVYCYVRIRGKGSLRWGAIEAEELSGKEASRLPEDAGWADKSPIPKL